MDGNRCDGLFTDVARGGDNGGDIREREGGVRPNGPQPSYWKIVNILDEG